MKSRLLKNLRHKARRQSWEALSLPQSVYKVVVLGPGGVGKTSLIQRFVMDQFLDDYTPTVEDVYEKSVTLNKDFGAFLEILDTAGSYRFPAMKRLTIERGEAFILVYSLNDETTIEEVLRLQQEIKDIKGTSEVPVLIVGNKTDLVSKETREQIRDKVTKLVGSQHVLRPETSAKYGINVNSIFYALLGQIAVVNSEHIRRSSSAMTV